MIYVNEHETPVNADEYALYSSALV